MYNFIIDSVPIAWSRAGYNARSGFVLIYDRQSKEKKMIKSMLGKLFQQEILDEPLSIEFIFHMPTPKTKKLKEGDPHTKKPDLDNLVKFLLDCMNGQVFRDDSLVYSIKARKSYAKYPRTEIKIKKIEEKDGLQPK